MAEITDQVKVGTATQAALTTAHIGPHPPSRPLESTSPPKPGRLEIARGGTFLHLLGQSYVPERQGRGVRAGITDFTRSSQRRMRHRVESLNWEAALKPQQTLQWFLTLTVHQDMSLEDAHRAMKAWRRRLYRLVPSTLAVWKLEAQRRGAPHYHLILVVDGNEVLSAVGCELRRESEAGELLLDLMRMRFQDWALRSWRECTGQPTITQVRLEDPRSWNGIRGYLVGYMSKKHAVPKEWQGRRYWGLWGDWPTSTIEVQLEGDSRWR